MIVPMHKVYVVARRSDREALLERVGELGLVHLTPVDPSRAVPDEQTIIAMENLRLAGQLLSGIEPAGSRPAIDPSTAAAEVLDIHRDSAEIQTRLSSLMRQVDQLALWGDTRREDVEALRAQGVNIKFYAVPAGALGEVRAQCVQQVGQLAGKRVVVAAVNRDGEPVVPEGAEELELPGRDRPSLKAEAAELDDKLRAGRKRLGELAQLRDEMNKEYLRREEVAKFTVAARGAMLSETLFALQGWCPTDRSDRLAELLREGGIDTAVQPIEPGEDEKPPTLIKYPRWAMPIKGLSEILMTFPGYREYDLSAFFMLALPLFAAMLIGDAGYGLVFLLPALIWRRKLSAKAGAAKVQLLIVVGFATLVWGVITGNYFGVGPAHMAQAGGYVQELDAQTVPDIEAMKQGTDAWAKVGSSMLVVAPLWRADEEAARMLLIQLSFLIGTLHLVSAHLRQVVGYWPSQQAFAEIGWCFVLVAMLGVVWMMFFDEPPVPTTWIVMGIVLGLVLVVLFQVPRKNPLLRVSLGIASSLLPTISTFSDTMSYIRLMAVGLASFYIATAFNTLSADMAESLTWFAAAPVVVFGHLLNIVLGVIAVFAHGVRLNMLEFSNNAGVQWSGYPYAPFSRMTSKES